MPSDKLVQKRIARIMLAVMRSSDTDLCILSALCILEYEYRGLQDDVLKMKNNIRFRQDKQD